MTLLCVSFEVEKQNVNRKITKKKYEYVGKKK